MTEKNTMKENARDKEGENESGARTSNERRKPQLDDTHSSSLQSSSVLGFLKLCQVCVCDVHYNLFTDEISILPGEL